MKDESRQRGEPVVKPQMRTDGHRWRLGEYVWQPRNTRLRCASPWQDAGGPPRRRKHQLLEAGGGKTSVRVATLRPRCDAPLRRPPLRDAQIRGMRGDSPAVKEQSTVRGSNQLLARVSW